MLHTFAASTLCLLAGCGGGADGLPFSSSPPPFGSAAPMQPAATPPPSSVNPSATPVQPAEAPNAGLPLNMPPGTSPGDDDSDPALPPVNPNPGCVAWPAATGSEQVSDTIDVSGTFDGGMKRFVGTGALGSGSQTEGQPAFFALEDGAVLKNVILGAPAADGIHCEGSCVLENVWWEDVGEDAATFDGDRDTDVMDIRCSGARRAADKILQHNGPGTMLITDFFAEDFGKVYRSCGNCREQFDRHVELHNVTATDGNTLAGINENFGDTASFENVSADRDITVCELYRANDTGAEPVSIGEGPDAEHCLYQSDDISAL